MSMNNVLTTLVIFKDHFTWPDNYCVAEVQEGGALHLLDLTVPEEDRNPHRTFFNIDGNDAAGLPMLDDLTLVGSTLRREIFEAACDASHFDRDYNLYYHDTDSVWYMLDVYTARWEIADERYIPTLFQLMMDRDTLEKVRTHMQYDLVPHI